MKKLYITWHDDYVSSDLEIDLAYRRIFNAGLLLYHQIEEQKQCPECILELCQMVTKLVTEHMEHEIETLKKLGIQGYQAHERDHEYFMKRFDMQYEYDFSPKMRVIVCAKMIKEFLNLHFFNYDVPDLQRIREHFAVFDRIAS